MAIFGLGVSQKETSFFCNVIVTEMSSLTHPLANSEKFHGAIPKSVMSFTKHNSSNMQPPKYLATVYEWGTTKMSVVSGSLVLDSDALQDIKPKLLSGSF